MPRLCQDLAIEPEAPLLDCCGICTEFPRCLYIDVAQFTCDESGCGRSYDPVWTLENFECHARPVEHFLAGSMSTAHETRPIPGGSETVDLCQWKWHQEVFLLDPLTLVYLPPVGYLCYLGEFPRSIPPYGYCGTEKRYVPMSDLWVLPVWNQYTGFEGWNAYVYCSARPGTGVLLWQGVRQPYLDGPVGEYVRTDGRDQRLTIIVEECNPLP